MKLCVFQGTFNPIHNGHIKMAEHVLSNFDFDKIIFIPAFKPPHKYYDEELTPHRLKMAKLATEYNEKFIVSDIEYQNERMSYTYLTIQELYKKYGTNNKIYFIIGTDAFEKIDTWYESEKLKKLIKFIVFNRANEGKIRINNAEYEYTTMEPINVSSTEIRDKIKAGRIITGMVPRKVEEYIEQNGLYK